MEVKTGQIARIHEEEVKLQEFPAVNERQALSQNFGRTGT